ncbi:fatty acyl-CoA reductase wat-like [Halictus rubicundus]|uniref:fatty acyl-CoA reductase wat-like n=1 Tax=Halictus rubicundus TaxID=77578 RepID=UPI0040371ED6
MASDINEANNLSNSSESQASENNGRSEIAEFYNGTNVLVTGGTGFIGKLLIEKLLRSCPGIVTMYMMVRPKKGKSPEERFKESFDEVVYDRLRQEKPDFLKKVVMVVGDAAEEDLGMTPETREMLKNTNFIFHVAAHIRFDDKLRVLVNTNVRTTKCLLLWARQLTNLKAFVYVSTAFSNCLHKTIEEIHYKPPIEADNLISLVNSLNDDQLEAIGPALFPEIPNNYIVSKAAAENVVLKYGDGIPAGIVRPSIVTATAEEPIKAWTNNLYGVTGPAVGTGIGLMRTMHVIPEHKADIIPADYVVATVIAAAWDIGTRESLRKLEPGTTLPDVERVPVYNAVTSSQKPLTWQQYLEWNREYGMQVPSVKCIWYFMFICARYEFLFHIYAFFLQTIPGFIVDNVARLMGRTPMLLDAYRKIHKFSVATQYFSTREWDFRNENVQTLWRNLNSDDQKIFNFNVENIDWREYFYYYLRGLRMYIVGDPMDTLDEARVKYSRLRVVHYTVVTLVVLLLLWIAASLVLFVWPYYHWNY